MRWGTALAVGVAALAAAVSAGVVSAIVSGGDPSDEAARVQAGGEPPPTGTGSVGPGEGPDIVATPVSLEGLPAYSTCGAFLEDVQRHAFDLVGPWGLTQYGGPRGLAMTDVIAVEEAAAPAESAPAPAAAEAPAISGDLAGGSVGTDFSGTNIQEIGVDEPDIVKTDGVFVYAIAQGRLWVSDARGRAPQVLDSIELSGWDQRLLLAGDRVLVLGQGDPYALPYGEEAPDDELLPAEWPQTTLTLIDVSDPRALHVLETLTVEGVFLDARQTGDSARIVVSSFPTGLEFSGPIREGFLGETIATTRNRGVIARTSVSDWLPGYVHHDYATGETTGGLVSCEGVRRPDTFAGLGMLTILTIDLANGLPPVDTDSVMTDGQLVYASPTALYVATQQWIDWEEAARTGRRPEGLSTLIHKFAIDDPLSTEYRASGEVRGYLLNQFSMSEYEGHLRVATTDQPAWCCGDGLRESESFVTVLADDDGRLRTVGSVGGLGRGEQVFAVRFLGDVGYVVTFRQVDPLYTIDLSDPTRPTVRGELKIRGYSAYLHPIDGGLVLGIGQDADRSGRLRGTQISLFDVSDLDDPVRLQAEQLGRGAASEVEYDHHAFLWWAPSELAVIPVQGFDTIDEVGQQAWYSAAVGNRVDAHEGIDPVGAVTHPDGAQIRRSLVIGDTLLTLSELGLMSSDLDTFVERGWTPFS